MSAEAAANWVLLVVTLGIAIVGWHRGNAAARRARGADERADEALDLARSAEERADRLEQLQTERRHIVWDRQDDTDRDIVTFTNAGTDTAYDAHLVADIKGYPRQDAHLDQVEPTMPITVNVTTVATEERGRQAEAIRRTPGFIAVPTVHVRLQITWRSELGVPHIEDLGTITL